MSRARRASDTTANLAQQVSATSAVANVTQPGSIPVSAPVARDVSAQPSAHKVEDYIPSNVPEPTGELGDPAVSGLTDDMRTRLRIAVRPVSAVSNGTQLKVADVVYVIERVVQFMRSNQGRLPSRLWDQTLSPDARDLVARHFMSADLNEPSSSFAQLQYLQQYVESHGAPLTVNLEKLQAKKYRYLPQGPATKEGILEALRLVLLEVKLAYFASSAVSRRSKLARTQVVLAAQDLLPRLLADEVATELCFSELIGAVPATVTWTAYSEAVFEGLDSIFTSHGGLSEEILRHFVTRTGEVKDTKKKAVFEKKAANRVAAATDSTPPLVAAILPSPSATPSAVSESKAKAESKEAKGDSRRAGPKPIAKCFNCGVPGHVAPSCPHAGKCGFWALKGACTRGDSCRNASTHTDANRPNRS